MHYDNTPVLFCGHCKYWDCYFDENKAKEEQKGRCIKFPHNLGMQIYPSSTPIYFNDKACGGYADRFFRYYLELKKEKNGQNT